MAGGFDHQKGGKEIWQVKAVTPADRVRNIFLMVKIHREPSISGYCVELQKPAEKKRPGWYLAADTL